MIKKKLHTLVSEYSMRNKKGECSEVYSVTNSQGFIPSTDYFSKEVFSKDLSTYKIVENGMIAYNPSRINVGSVAVQRALEKVIVSPLYVVFSVKEDELLPEFLVSYLHSDVGLQQIATHTSGSVRDSLKFNALQDIEINLYSIDDQKVIIEKLQKLESAIKKKKMILQKFDDLVKSQFIEMFGDPVGNTYNWEAVNLGELGELNRGVSKARPRNAPELLGGIHPLVQTGEVSNCDTYITTYTNTYSDKGLAQSRKWAKGTLCITIAANIAQTGILTFDACFPDSVVGFIAGEKTTNIFIHYWFKFFQKILEDQAPQVAQKNINLKILNDLKVILPPKSKQKEFSRFVEQLDKSKFRIKQSLEKLEICYKALLQKYFG